ncbi:MAG: SpoIIE family protein phosphatase [Bacteroidota bacterium]
MLPNYKFQKLLKKYILIILYILYFIPHTFSQSIPDLEEKLETASDEDKPGILNQLSEASFKSSVDKSIDYAEQALKAAKKIDDINEETGAIINLGNGYEAKGNHKKAINHYKNAIIIFDNHKQFITSAYLWNKIADANLAWNKPTDAITANEKSVELLKLAKDKRGTADILLEIGDIYFNQKKYDNAVNYFKQSFKILEELKDPRSTIIILNRIGTAYSNWGNFDEAYMFLNYALDIAKKNKFNSEAETISKNIAVIKSNLSNWKKSQTEYEQQQKQQMVQEKQQMVQEKQQMIQAERQQQQQIHSLAIQNVKSIEEIEKLSIENQVKELKIKVQNDEILKKQFEFANKKKENELLKKEKELVNSELNKQKIIIWSVIGFSVLVLILTSLIFIAYRNKKRANSILQQKNQIIYNQKSQIEQKNILITDSIDYAKNIQEAMLQPQEALRNFFPESFILFKPKDIVSGDFYWFTALQNGIGVAAADCTGHGVPGAFMSLLSFTMLDEIAKNNSNNSTADILSEINSKMMKILHQNQLNKSGKFGMDIALTIFNKSMNELHYSGAHNSLILIRNGQLQEIKADKIFIGSNPEVSFSNNNISLQHNDIIYLFSDGYYDQIGGEKKKKFLSFYFKEMLINIHSLSMDQQKEELEKKHNEWRNNVEQTDDILVLGIKYK